MVLFHYFVLLLNHRHFLFILLFEYLHQSTNFLLELLNLLRFSLVELVETVLSLLQFGEESGLLRGELLFEFVNLALFLEDSSGGLLEKGLEGLYFEVELADFR